MQNRALDRLQPGAQRIRVEDGVELSDHASSAKSRSRILDRHGGYRGPDREL